MGVLEALVGVVDVDVVVGVGVVDVDVDVDDEEVVVGVVDDDELLPPQALIAVMSATAAMTRATPPK